MSITYSTMPIMTQQFYDRIKRAFPPFDIRAITKDTTLEDIYREKGIKEVLDFIDNNVPDSYKDNNVVYTQSVWQQLKNIKWK